MVTSGVRAIYVKVSRQLTYDEQVKYHTSAVVAFNVEVLNPKADEGARDEIILDTTAIQNLPDMGLLEQSEDDRD